jgi:hypothetical protein
VSQEQPINTSSYVHPRDPHLHRIENAMKYNAAGEPVIRADIGSDIIINGDVNIPGTVTVNSTPEDPVHTHITEVGTSGILAVPYMPIQGTVSIGTDGTVSLSANTLSALENITVGGTVELGATTLSALENITVSGTVELGATTLSALENIGVTGTFWQTTQPVSIATMPTTPVTGTFWQATQPVSGTVTVQDGGNTITVDGTVTANVTFPTTQQVSGTVALDTNTLTALENINATVSGTVSIGSDGTVSLSAATLSALENINATVSGTVELGTTTLSALENINATISDGGGSITVDGTVNAVFTGTVTTTVVDGQQDAFGRLRVSEAFTLGDYKHTYGIDPNFRDTYINGGTVTHIANQACARLATTSNTSSRAIHQTKMYHNYMPGKSQLIKSTINFYAHTANVTKRTGYFDDLNGIYFEQNGAGVLSFVIRTNTSGTASDARRIVQADWNKDKCDGTGASGFNLDITKTQIVFIDFQWLGVGRVRCGFVHDGQMIVAHEFYNSNNLPVVYMSNPNLPVRCEILNTGTSTGGYFDQICSTVISEGGYIESGIDFSVDTGQTSQSITTADGMYPVVAIRLKNSFRGYPNRVVVRSGNINVYAEEYPAYWALFKLDNLSEITLSDPTWTSANADSAVEYTLLATAFTGGDKLDGGIVGTTSPGGSAKGTGTAPVNQPSNAKKNFIAQNLDSTDSEIYVVCGKAIGGTTKMWVDFQWREIY